MVERAPLTGKPGLDLRDPGLWDGVGREELGLARAALGGHPAREGGLGGQQAPLHRELLADPLAAVAGNGVRHGDLAPGRQNAFTISW